MGIAQNLSEFWVQVATIAALSSSPFLLELCMSALAALSPLDGRYADKVASLSPIFSEFGLIKRRLRVEVEWLIALAAEPGVAELPELKTVSKSELRGLVNNLTIEDAAAIKTIERSTNHDVKAIEYWLKDKMSDDAKLAGAREFVHFAMTSEDVNNLAYALMLKDAREQVLLPELDKLIAALQGMAHVHASLPMLSRTHGQTASPTTLGKELANVVARLQRQRTQLAQIALMGKCAGAVSNYNAHVVSYPEVPWQLLSQAFVEGLGLEFNPLTTQIEPHDFIAEYCDVCRRISVILIDFARDVWGYVSLGYFTQLKVDGEVGSSTMPHKVNPIDFENAEGNLGLANALFGHFSEKLPISRWQRDLSDSTVLRALGSGFGHWLLAIHSLQRGLGKLKANPAALAADLDQSWEVLAEAIQTVMRRYGLPQPYEQLKNLTRGAKIDAAATRAFIETLELPANAKTRLLALRPDTYIGLAPQLAKLV
jgi:adenylosuccinate lyase